jgi:hypothetical protein
VPEEDDEMMMKPLAAGIQRQENPEGEEDMMMKPLSQEIQRQDSLEEEDDEMMLKPLMQRQADGGGVASAALESSIAGARGQGQPLSAGVRGSMEQAFGADFSSVKIHTGSTAHQLNQSVQARAFTTGQDIFFRQGEYQPDNIDGQELLAHELTHVVQQNPVAVQPKSVSSLSTSPTIQRDPPTPQGNPAEASPYDAIQDYVNDVASEWGLLAGRFNLALRNFSRTMTMASEDEAVPDVAGALVKHVTSQITGAALSKVEGLVPGWSHVKGALDAMTAELDRADTAKQELALRDFLMTVDTVTTEGFENQERAVRSGREDLVKEYNDLSPEIQPMFIESLDNWLETLRQEMPKHEDYQAHLFVDWLNMHQGQLRGFEELGVIEIKFNAEEPGIYEFESAKVMSTFANKAASGLNWVMRTPATGAKNVLDLPVRKKVGLYVENLVGGTSYGWFHLDAQNNTTQYSVLPMAVKRWSAMPWAPLEAITKVSG